MLPPLVDRGLERVELVPQELHPGAVLQLYLRQGQGFPLQAHVVAVRPFDQAFDFPHLGRGRGAVHKLLGPPHFALEVHVLSAVSGGIDVRQVARDEFMA